MTVTALWPGPVSLNVTREGPLPNTSGADGNGNPAASYAPTARAMRRRMPPSCSDVTRDGVGVTRFIDTLLTW